MFKQVFAICAIFAALVANEKKDEVKATETTTEVKATETTTEVKAEETKKDANVDHKEAKKEETDKKDEAKK